MTRVETRYKPDRQSMRAFLMSKSVQDAATAAAQRVATIAAATAPRSSSKKSDHFAEHFKVETGEPKEFSGNLRRTAKVVNDSNHAVQVEFGTARTRKHRTLAKAALQVGEFRGPGLE